MTLLLVIVEGQLYLLGVLAIFATEIAFLLWGLWSRRPIIALMAVFVMVPLLRSTLSAIRAFFVRADPPDGVPLDRTAGDGLYAVVDDIRRQIGAPPIHRIVVTPDFNAGAVRLRPRGGMRRHRTLTLGLPMLATLSTAEIRAVIAHELAHFSRAHDPYSAWVYRTRRSWFALYRLLDERMATPLYVYWLIRWYVPRLNAASAAVARRHELLADRAAAGAAGGRAAADALVVVEVGARFAAETYWPALSVSHETEETPPRPFTGMLGWDARIHLPAVLADTLSRDAGSDTHPSIRERIAQLGEDVRLPPVAARSAGDELLGPVLAALAGRLDEQWLGHHEPAWRERRAMFVDKHATLARLSALASPTPEELFARAELVASLADPDEALALYRRAAAQGHASAALALGRLLLDRGEASGIASIEDAMTRDERLVPAGCRILAEYYASTNQDLLARQCERRSDRYLTRAHLASR